MRQSGARLQIGGLTGGTRTPDLLLRRQLLYPVELRSAKSTGHCIRHLGVCYELTVKDGGPGWALCMPRRCLLSGKTAVRSSLEEGGSLSLLQQPSRWMVGAERFELPTLWSQTRCATRLRYAPKGCIVTDSGRVSGSGKGCGAFFFCRRAYRFLRRRVPAFSISTVAPTSRARPMHSAISSRDSGWVLKIGCRNGM